MQPSVIVRRFMLVSGLGELVPIILDTSLACGLTVRPCANMIIDTVTYLVDETSTVLVSRVMTHPETNLQSKDLRSTVENLHFHTSRLSLSLCL
jgi:hypothetical protein